MEGKQLNIEFAENVDPSLMEDNFWDHYDNQQPPPNYLEASASSEIVQSKDSKINDLQMKLSELELKASLYDDKEELYKDKLKFKDEVIEALRLTIDSNNNETNASGSLQTKKKTAQLLSKLQDENEKISLKAKDEEIKKLKSQVKLKNQELINCKELLEMNMALVKKCNTFRDIVMKIRNTIYIKVEYGGTTLSMHVPKLKAFEPVLDNQIAGPGWIVIQRRVDGKTDFETNLNNYYEGFGNIKEDFWLGLERIHKITTHQQHELYIHIVDFDGKPHYAKYDNFVVGSKDEKYVLKSLGKYTGNANDMMRLNEGRVFALGSKRYLNGWWWLDNAIPSCNLNGKYSKVAVTNEEYIFWGLKSWGNCANFIKSVQMLIRPKKQ